MNIILQQSEVNTNKISGAEAVVQSLVHEGVSTLFGYPGGAIMPVYDALLTCGDGLNHILTRHEQGAVHAAQGYARVSGKVGVVLATSGPGATNLITGLMDAMMDSTPVVCITGQVNSGLLGTDAFQEADVIGASLTVTKWNCLVKSADEIPQAIAKAFYIAKSGRPGPVLIDITKDAQFGDTNFKYKYCNYVEGYKPNVLPESKKLQTAAELINSAKRPYLLFGQGVSTANAEAELRAFIEKTGIPAAWSILGAPALPSKHPLNMGMLGMHGNYSPNIKTNECDVLIGVGLRFDDRITGNPEKFAPQAKLIHIDIDASEMGKIKKPSVGIVADARLALKELHELVLPRKHSDWVHTFKTAHKTEVEKVISKELSPMKEKLSMGEVINQVNHLTKGKLIWVSDVGQHQMMVCRYAQLAYPRSLLNSGGLGTMGFGLPAAIGAKLGAPDKTVLAVLGDGGFQMTMQELGTIMQSNVDVKILILNNGFLGMVRQWQDLFFEKRYAFTEMKNPDFTLLAKAYGIRANKVSKREKLADAVAEMLDYKGPYLLEAVVEREDNVFPMIPSGASVAEIKLE